MGSKAAREEEDEAPAVDLDLSRLVGFAADPAAPTAADVKQTGAAPGPIVSRSRGDGLEFDDLRPHAVGDDIRRIDWRATARSDEPVTRVFRAERERTTTVVADFRPSMFTGTRRLRAVVAGETAARSIWRAVRLGDRVSVAIADARGLEVTRPRSGDTGALDACFALARGFSAARSLAGSAHDLAGILDRVAALGRRAGGIELVTGLDDPGDDLDGRLAALDLATDLSVVLVLDAAEEQGLPPGRYAASAGRESRLVQLDRRSAAATATAIRSETAAVLARIAALGVPIRVAGREG